MNKLLRHFAYKDWQELIKGHELPAIFVDLDQFDANLLTFKKIADEKNKKIRLATKSLRVPFLIDHVLKSSTTTYQGLMCFSVSEAFQLFKMGHKDLLVAYPTHSELDLKHVQEIKAAGGKCVLTFDHLDHLSWAAQVWKKISSDALDICLDLDASLKIFGLHLGVRRSSIVSINEFSDRLEQLLRFPELKLRGLLHYEAQIAGLPDRDHEFILLQKIKEAIRKYSGKTVRAEREKFLKVLNEKSLNIDFFNGGGTGSIDSSTLDPITEVTVGSGLLQSHLFDKYSNCHSFAAEFFVLPITRLPAKKIITCQSGGFIASGEVGKNKSPEIHLPKMLKIIPSENFGEVQTPFVSQSLQEFNLGDPIILRPAKSGEIMERFNRVILVRSGKIVEIVPTYRGLGFNFY